MIQQSKNLNTATDQSRVIEELTAELDALRREVEAGLVAALEHYANRKRRIEGYDWEVAEKALKEYRGER